MVEYFYGRYIEPAFELCMKIQRISALKGRK